MENNINNNTSRLGFAGKMAKIFVMNSRLSILLIITIFAWGIFSFLITPKQYNPEIVAPAFNIITEYPGASSNEIQELITKPIEDKIKDIDGVDKIMSQSIDGGVSIVTVQFYVGENMEDSKIKISQKIQGNIDLKPAGAKEPIIKDINPDDVPILVFTLTSNTFSENALRKLALDIKDEIKPINNTSNIQIIGGRKKEFKILLNPNELNTKNISIMEIISALQKNNLKMQSGELEPGNEKKILIEIDGNIETVKNLEKIALRSEEAHTVYLSDVATIKDSEEEITNFVKYSDKYKIDANTVFISIAKKKGSNVTKVSDDVLDKINDLKLSLIPDSVNIDIARNEGKTASDEIFGLVINLIEAIIIVSIILFLFLGRNAAIVVAVTIPLVLASVFGIGLLAGQTINRITLFALILSLGLLVDNATVVVENSVRHLKINKKRKNSEGIINTDNRNAFIYAVDEVGMGLFMSTITTLLAFFPMAFVTGMMGPYMDPIPFFVPAALVFSMLIAFTINPFLGSVLIKDNSNQKSKTKDKLKITDKIQKKTRIIKWKILNQYKKILSVLFLNKKLRKKVLVTTFITLILVMTLPLFGLVKFRMLPKADREQFYIYLDFPEGTNVVKNKEITDKLENFLLQEKEIISLQSFIGTPAITDFNGLFKGSNGRNKSYNTTIKVNLNNHKNRKINSETLVQNIRPKIYKFLKNESNVKIKLIEDPPGPPVLSTVLIKIKGKDYEKLKSISREIEKMVNNTKEIVDIDTSKTDKQEKISLKIDYKKATQSGINTENISYVLRTALSGMQITTVHDDEEKEQKFITLRFDKKYRQTINDLNQIFISNQKGKKIPLSEIVTEEKGEIEDVIYNNNQEKTIYVYGEMGNRSVTYAILDIYKKLFNFKLDDNNGEINKISFFGVDYRDKISGEIYKIEWGGEWKLTVEVFRDLSIAMFVAIFLIYLVLVAQFHSFTTPILIMITIPLALIGVLPGFALLGLATGTYFNATSMIGVIALAGIVVNNAIILVEYLNSFRGKGYTAEEALIEAGQTRMRPIVLTSLTTILGSLTIISDPVWAGLAWSIIFGISISTALTLIIFPVLYYNFQGKKWVCDKPKKCESHGPSLY